MFGDLADMFVQGQVVTAHGEEWILLKPLGNGNFMAVKADSVLPSEVFVIKYDKGVPKQ